MIQTLIVMIAARLCRATRHCQPASADPILSLLHDPRSRAKGSETDCVKTTVLGYAPLKTG
jgi:hypothetical protein